MSTTTPLTLAQIDEGIDALLGNASQLVSEARTLGSIQAFARAFALAHLAREELSKLGMLQSAAIRILAEHPVDWKKLMSRLKDHKAKLFLEQIEQSLLAQGLSDDPQTSVLLKFAAPMVEHRNNQKNASLYVGFENGRFVTPASRFDEVKAMRTIRMAELRLEEQQFNRSRLGRYAEREIGSLRGIPRIDELSPDELEKHIPESARLTALIAQHRERELSTAPSTRSQSSTDA